MVPYKKAVIEVAAKLGTFSCTELYEAVLARYPEAHKAGIRGALYRLVREGKIAKLSSDRYAAQGMCPECGGEVSRENGEQVCTSCGLVVEQHIATNSKLVWSEHAEPRPKYRSVRRSPFYRQDIMKARLDASNTLIERRISCLHGVLRRRNLLTSDVKNRAEYLLHKLLRRTGLRSVSEGTLEALVDIVLLERFPQRRLALTADRRRRVKHIARVLNMKVSLPLNYPEMLDYLLSNIPPSYEVYELKREIYCGVNAAKDLLQKANAWAVTYSHRKKIESYGYRIEDVVDNPEIIAGYDDLRGVYAKLKRRRFASKSFLTAFCYAIAESLTPKLEEPIIHARGALTPRAERAVSLFVCMASRKPTETTFHALRNLTPELAIVSREVLLSSEAGKRFLKLMNGQKEREYRIPCSAVGYELVQSMDVSESSVVWHVFKIRKAVELKKGQLYEALTKALGAVAELRS